MENRRHRQVLLRNGGEKMKTFCFECKHDCHCGRKCDYCSCYICNNIIIKTYEDYMGGNMIKKIWEKIKSWLTSWIS